MAFCLSFHAIHDHYIANMESCRGEESEVEIWY